jgi:hypothetical protein
MGQAMNLVAKAVDGRTFTFHLNDYYKSMAPVRVDYWVRVSGDTVTTYIGRIELGSRNMVGFYKVLTNITFLKDTIKANVRRRIGVYLPYHKVRVYVHWKKETK